MIEPILPSGVKDYHGRFNNAANAFLNHIEARIKQDHKKLRIQFWNARLKRDIKDLTNLYNRLYDYRLLVNAYNHATSVIDRAPNRSENQKEIWTISKQIELFREHLFDDSHPCDVSHLVSILAAYEMEAGIKPGRTNTQITKNCGSRMIRFYSVEQNKLSASARVYYKQYFPKVDRLHYPSFCFEDD